MSQEKFTWTKENYVFTAPSEDAVKAKDMDGDGYVFDNTPKQRPATAEEKKAGSPKSKGQKLLEKKMQANALKKPKTKKGGGKKKLTEEEKAAEKEKKHQEKVKAQVAQIDDYTEKMQAELERLTKLGDSFKDESNLRKRLGQKIKQLQTKKARLLDSKQGVDAGAEDMLSEAATKALDAPSGESAWIGFYLSTHDAEAIEDERLEEMGECEERPHITIAMTGELTDDDVFSIGFKLQQIAEQFKPVQGKISGTGVFNQEDADCLYASFDSPQLPALREAIAKALGEELDDMHGFTPHITLCYCEKGTDTSAIEIPTLDLVLPTLTFAVGTVNYNYVLGYGYAGEQDWSEAVEEDDEMDGDMMPAKASYHPVPFFDMVGQKAFARTPEGRIYGVIEQIKRFGEYEGLTATKDNPVVVVAGKAYQSTDVEILIDD